jgi:hypothetical protein
LQGRTPKEVPFVEVVFFELGTAQPAPLIPALGTSHVVAPFVLYFSYSCLTLGAIYHVAFIFGPVEVLNIISLRTCLSFVLLEPAFKANNSPACLAAGVALIY